MWVKSSDLRVWDYFFFLWLFPPALAFVASSCVSGAGSAAHGGDALARSPPLLLVGCFFSCVMRQRQHALGFELQLLAGCLCCSGTL